MDDIDIIDWQEGTGDSVEIGYLNPNGQQCFGHSGNRPWAVCIQNRMYLLWLCVWNKWY